MSAQRIARYYVTCSGLYKHSLWAVGVVLLDENNVECDGGHIRQFDSKREAKAAARLMNEGIPGGKAYGRGWDK